ncbi:MAG: hypothetical protein HY645_03640 [Acidobacteria bacterium]|nr:hypothetical protein [Acidobacteriota bacterium]
MRYLVTARLKSACATALLRAIRNGTLGSGSMAGDEYLRNMRQARLLEDGRIRWVEVCYCSEPLQEERPYWEDYFELDRIQDTHDRRRCRDQTGAEPWACSNCACTVRLEQRLSHQGRPFLKFLRNIFSEDPEKKISAEELHAR